MIFFFVSEGAYGPELSRTRSLDTLSKSFLHGPALVSVSLLVGFTRTAALDGVGGYLVSVV